jgi:hypothetical protein
MSKPKYFKNLIESLFSFCKHHVILTKIFAFFLVLIIGLSLSIRPKVFFPLRCKSQYSTCQSNNKPTTSKDHHNHPPNIHINYPNNGDLTIPRQANIQLTVCDQDQDIDPKSINLNTVHPGSDQAFTDFADSKRINYTMTENSNCYRFTITPTPTKLPQNNTVIWRTAICDCQGNNTSKTIITATSPSILRYVIMQSFYLLLYVVWFLVLFGPHLRRPKGGKVYDAITNQPLSQAIIRILSQDNKLIHTSATDIKGHFHINLNKGKYKIIVQRANYKFPSKIENTNLKSNRTIYTGGLFEIKNNNTPLRKAIPLDPINIDPESATKHKFISKINHMIININPILPIASSVYMTIAWLRPPWIRQVVTFDIVNALLVFYQLYLKKKNETRLGQIVNTKGEPLPNIDVGLYKMKYEKLLKETQTGQNGHFVFIVPGGQYFIKILDSRFKIANPEFSQGYPIKKEKDQFTMIAPKIEVIRVEDD